MDERSGLAERQRQDQEKAEVNRARQLRQGHISEESEETEEEPKPKPKAKSSSKKSE